MKTIRTLLVAVTVVMILVIVVPVVIGKRIKITENLTDEPSMDVTVTRGDGGEEEVVPVDEYLVGVVAAEMPANFEIEALKAQAVAARTYILKETQEKGGLSEITDSVNHQVYKNNDELKVQWGEDYQANLSKIQSAVEDTKGEVITYNGDPITALFFSTSNGITENSGDYYANDLPYLVSVDSEWDIGTPKYSNEVSIPIHEVESKLGLSIPSEGEITTEVVRTDGGNVSEVNIGGETFTGREVREKLGLQSTDFTMELNGDDLVVTTRGYGHDVGMSQFGANEMAKLGYNHDEIISHYYTGVEISNIESYSEIITALK